MDGETKKAIERQGADPLALPDGRVVDWSQVEKLLTKPDGTPDYGARVVLREDGTLVKEVPTIVEDIPLTAEQARTLNEYIVYDQKNRAQRLLALMESAFRLHREIGAIRDATEPGESGAE